MSNSGKKQIARARMKYSGEKYEASLAGIPNVRAHGLDSCSRGQEEFRALLALGLFNRGSIAAPPGEWGLHSLTWYTITVSPRWQRLVFISRAPDNVMQYFVPVDLQYSRLPGMRLIGVHGSGILARHIPTGAEFASTSRVDGACAVEGKTDYRFMLGVDEPLFEEEKRRLRAIPPMSRDGRFLLAGLLTRMSMVDARKNWATGNWFWDPLQREDVKARRTGDPQRRLWGAQGEWDIQWTGYPHPRDVALAMTDPVVGVEGARLDNCKGSYEVTLRSAVLRIRK